MIDSNGESDEQLEFFGGFISSLIPFLLFIVGVVFISLSGAPDERGFWPVLILALGVGLLLAKDKTHFSKTVIRGMSHEIVMIMITAWILASIIGILMTLTGFVDSLIWIAGWLNVGGVGFVITTFVICCAVSLSTGSSFATILICSPLLYPAGGLLGSHLPTLAGAIIGGATFGDFIAPISDTTIVSSLSQKEEIGEVVKSRIKYMIPASALAFFAYLLSAWFFKTDFQVTEIPDGNPKGLPMLLVPILIIYLFLKSKHLLHGLMYGLFFGTGLALVFGLLSWNQLLYLDLENFTAKSFIIDGINRAVGISFFTILLLGLIETIKASGTISRLVAFAASRSQSRKQGEIWIASVTGVAVLLTTHTIVAILMVAEFVSKTGKRLEIPGVHRANLMSMVGCSFPFMLPYFLPVILMANMTNSGSEYGISTVSPLLVGLHNFVSWTLLLAVMLLLIVRKYKIKKESI